MEAADEGYVTPFPVYIFVTSCAGTRADAELVLYGIAVDVAQDKGSASLAIRSLRHPCLHLCFSPSLLSLFLPSPPPPLPLLPTLFQ